MKEQIKGDDKMLTQALKDKLFFYLIDYFKNPSADDIDQVHFQLDRFDSMIKDDIHYFLDRNHATDIYIKQKKYIDITYSNGDSWIDGYDYFIHLNYNPQTFTYILSLRPHRYSSLSPYPILQVNNPIQLSIALQLFTDDQFDFFS